MHADNNITAEQRIKHKYHYAILYLLYDYILSSNANGYATMWIKTRWDPRKNLTYELPVLEIQLTGSPYKLEAWVFDDNLIILIADVEHYSDTYANKHIGLHPIENHRIDINDPNSIRSGIVTINNYLSRSNESPDYVIVHLAKTNTTLLALLLALILLLTYLIFRK